MCHFYFYYYALNNVLMFDYVVTDVKDLMIKRLRRKQKPRCFYENKTLAMILT